MKSQNAPTLSPPQSALRERELAARWGVSPRTLQRWRSNDVGPVFTWIGGSVRYLLADVEVYEASGRVGSGSR